MWAVATRVQLERWEAMVARFAWELIDKINPDPYNIWQAQADHHFALVAARHLLRAIELDGDRITVPALIAEEIKSGRDLLEHWDGNMPVFNVHPRTGTPERRSGKAFADRHPDGSPYNWLSYGNQTGPRLLPDLTAAELRDLLDVVQTRVLERQLDLERFIPPPGPPAFVRSQDQFRDLWPAQHHRPIP